MATLQQIIDYSKANPTTDYAKNAARLIKEGSFDQQAQKEGIDLSVFGRQVPTPNIQQPKPTYWQKVGQEVVGFGKAVGRSALGLAEMGSKTFPALGISGIPGFGSKETKNAFSEANQVLQPKNTGEKVGGYIETAAEFILPVGANVMKAGPVLIKKAENLYLKALKPGITLSSIERAKLVRTGIDEGIKISQQGVEKVGEVITNLEGQLATAIKKAGGRSILTSDLKPFVDTAKKFLGETVDVKGSEKAMKEIDAVYNNFVKKYGTNIPTDIAQTLKTNTYQVIKKYYDKMVAPTIEASKQLARGLKEGILKNAPEAGNINERLGNLYNFEEIVSRAANKVSNSNVVSLGGKILASGSNPVQLATFFINELFGATGKSMTSIGLDRIGQVLSKLSPEDTEILKAMINAGKVGATGLVGKVSNFLNGMPKQ